MVHARELTLSGSGNPQQSPALPRKTAMTLCWRSSPERRSSLLVLVQSLALLLSVVLLFGRDSLSGYC